jgi:hypothetical protein
MTITVFSKSDKIYIHTVQSRMKCLHINCQLEQEVFTSEKNRYNTGNNSDKIPKLHTYHQVSNFLTLGIQVQ